MASFAQTAQFGLATTGSHPVSPPEDQQPRGTGLPINHVPGSLTHQGGNLWSVIVVEANGWRHVVYFSFDGKHTAFTRRR